MNASLDLCDNEFDDDFSEGHDFDPEVERELLYFATSFSGEVKYIAKDYMTNFFRNETFNQGGKIPNSLLLSPSNILMVINYDIINGVKRAYSCLSNHVIDYDFTADEIPRDIQLVVNILNKLSDANIPQQFAGGMLLLYLKLVEGVEIG